MLSQYPRTYNHLLHLLDILKCENCERTLHLPHSNGVCDHVLCKDCCTSCNICPLCSTPYHSKDVQEHKQYSQLLVATRRLAKLLSASKNSVKSEPVVESKPINKDNAVITSKKPDIDNHCPSKDIKFDFPKPLIKEKPISTIKTKPEIRIRKKITPKVPIASPESSTVTDTSVVLGTEVSKNSRKSISRNGIKKAKTLKKTPDLLNTKHRVNNKGETILHKASIKNDLALAKLAVKDGIDLNSKDNAGWTPLHEAAVRENGCQVNIPAGPDLETPICEAVSLGYVEICRALLTHGADPNVETANGRNCHQIIENLLSDCSIIKANPSKMRLTSARSKKQLPDANEMQERYEAIKKLLNTTSVTIVKKNCRKSLRSHSKDNDRSVTGVTLIEKRRLKPVILASGVNRTQRTLLNKVASMLHAQVVSVFSSDVTHLITQSSVEIPVIKPVLTEVSNQNDLSNTCARSMKFLCALLQGCWILSFEWVEQCAYLKQRVEEECFEISGCSRSSIPLAPRRAREARENGSPGLFHGFRLCFLGVFTFPSPSRDELISLSRVGGGQTYVRDITTANRLASLAVGLPDEEASAIGYSLMNWADSCENSTAWQIIDENGNPVSKQAKSILIDGVSPLKPGSSAEVHKESLLLVTVPRQGTDAKNTVGGNIENLCKLAVEKLTLSQSMRPGETICSVPPPIRVVTPKWLMDCVANFRIEKLTAEHF